LFKNWQAGIKEEKRRREKNKTYHTKKDKARQAGTESQDLLWEEARETPPVQGAPE